MPGEQVVEHGFERLASSDIITITAWELFDRTPSPALDHTRPCLSNMPLWLLARWLQIFSSPQ